MHAAAASGHADAVTLLATKYGVDVNVRDKNSCTPMHRAAQEGQTNVVTLLAKEYGVDVNVRDKDGFTPMHAAAAQGDGRAAVLARPAEVPVHHRDLRAGHQHAGAQHGDRIPLEAHGTGASPVNGQ